MLECETPSKARVRFYRVASIIRRSFDPVNRGMLRVYFIINWMFRAEVRQRDGYPLGDEADDSALLEVQEPASSNVRLPLVVARQ